MLKSALFKLALAVLFICSANQAFAELKGSYTSQGNNLGMYFGRGSGAPWNGIIQYPRGSGNIMDPSRWGYGTFVVRDLDGDGTPEDTVVDASRGGRKQGNVASLEAYAQIEAFYSAGEQMSSATGRTENNPVFSSLDEDDLANWPAEFREGRSPTGAPILHGAETVALRVSNGWYTDGNAMGASLEYQCYFLDFGAANDMMFFHLFVRNMSEYLKWNDLPDFVARIGNPDGQVWNSMQMHYNVNELYYGSRDQSYGFHSPTGIHSIVDRSGTESSYTGFTPIMAHMQLKPFSHKGEEADLLTFECHGSAWGFPQTYDMLSGVPYGEAYLIGLGETAERNLYSDLGVINPWSGRVAKTFPGRLFPGDERYDRWIHSGTRRLRFHYITYGELHDFAPRDSMSVDAVIFFTHPDNEPVILPSNNIANIDLTVLDDAMGPILDMAQKAEVIYGGAYITPETPKPPPLTIIPGDREVTITWSDINIRTPDNYYLFLKEHPELDPQGLYREYDFEGYKLYRSYAGPNDAFSEVIWEGSVSDGSLAYSYVDRRDKDAPLYRMTNGMKVWYALVPFDKNVNLTTGDDFSLPDASAGKTWNRSGSRSTIVIARSDASNFKAATVDGEITFSAAYGSPVALESAELSSSGGVLTEDPLYLEPVASFVFEPIINERITSARTISITTAGTWMAYGGSNNRSSRTFKTAEGGKEGPESGELTVRNRNGSNSMDIMVSGPVEDVGTDYQIEATFKYMSNGDFRADLYYHMDVGNYSGEPGAVSTRGDDNRSGGYPPAIPGQIRAGKFELTWQSGGDGLTLQVVDVTRGYTLPFVEFPDQNYGWGLVTQEIFGDDDFEDDGNQYEDMVAGVAFASRSDKMVSSLPSDLSEDFAIWVNGMVWVLRDGGGMPASGTVFTLVNAFGDWDDDTFVQQPDPPFPGDNWQMSIAPMSMNAEDVDLSKIRAVPNPYMASSYMDLSPQSRRMEFTNLPDRCTIRIFTLSGTLVNQLNHISSNRNGWGNYTDWDQLNLNNEPTETAGYDNHGGTEPWNLRNRFGQTVASGLYFFHVTDSRGQTHTGKFYIVN